METLTSDKRVLVTLLAGAVAAAIGLAGAGVFPSFQVFRRWRHRRAIARQTVGGVVGRVSGLYLFPVKSCGAISVPSADLTSTGLAYDRRWMVARRNKEGKLQMISQRELPQMALIRPKLFFSDPQDPKRVTTLRLTFGGKAGPDGDVHLPLHVSVPAGDLEGVPREDVVVWPTKDPSENAQRAILMPKEAGRWLQSALQTPFELTLVFMDSDCVRMIGENLTKEVALPRIRNSFADTGQVLLAGESSVDELNARLPAGAAKVKLNRFRPNIVVEDTAAPFAEDTWKSIKFGDGPELESLKLCARCVMPSNNQETGVLSGIKSEPLITLRTFRKDLDQHNQCIFGNAMGHPHGDDFPGSATIRVGDRIRLLRSQKPARTNE